MQWPILTKSNSLFTKESVFTDDTVMTIAVMDLLTNEKTRFTVATGPAVFSGVVVDIDTVKKRAVSIERIQIRPE